MGLIFRLILLVLILYVILYLYKAFKKMNKVARTIPNPFRSTETCPACHREIQLSETNMVCPHCDTKLARNQDGKLLIRVN